MVGFELSFKFFDYTLENLVVIMPRSRLLLNPNQSPAVCLTRLSDSDDKRHRASKGSSIGVHQNIECKATTKWLQYGAIRRVEARIISPAVALNPRGFVPTGHAWYVRVGTTNAYPGTRLGKSPDKGFKCISHKLRSRHPCACQVDRWGYWRLC